MAIKHTIRTKDGLEEVRLTPIKAIVAFCSECNGFEPVVDSTNWIKKCLSKHCPLYPFRTGHAHTGRKPSAAIVKNLSKHAVEAKKPVKNKQKG